MPILRFVVWCLVALVASLVVQPAAADANAAADRHDVEVDPTEATADQRRAEQLVASFIHAAA